MFGKQFELFTMFGFKIRIDASWFLIFILVAWSLAAGVFPAAYPDLSTTVHWLMGLVGSLGLFAAIVVHELAHSLVARRSGMPMEGITLFLFGGVAQMTDEPPDAVTELKVAVAGPITSALIGILCFGALLLGAWPEAVAGVLRYLGEINLVVAVFNLLPAFPLDGGRVLRAILWKARGDLRWSTRIASQVGSGFGAALVVLAVLMVLLGNLLSGIWLFLIGLFLRQAAQGSYQQLLLRRALEGETVERFMHARPDAVPRSASVQRLVDDFVYRTHHKLYPVVEDDRLVGCVTTNDIKALPPDEWTSNTVSAIMSSCNDGNTIEPGADAMDALSRMRRSNTTRLLVVGRNDVLAGVLTMKDLLQFFALKLDLELDETPSPPLQA